MVKASLAQIKNSQCRVFIVVKASLTKLKIQTHKNIFKHKSWCTNLKTLPYWTMQRWSSIPIGLNFINNLIKSRVNTIIIQWQHCKFHNKTMLFITHTFYKYRPNKNSFSTHMSFTWSCNMSKICVILSSKSMFKILVAALLVVSLIAPAFSEIIFEERFEGTFLMLLVWDLCLFSSWCDFSLVSYCVHVNVCICDYLWECLSFVSNK